MNISIRKGLISDLPEALNLIKELAIYENAPDEVIVTIEDMELDGFGENPIFNFFVAEVEGKVVGISLYYIKYSTWKGKCVFLEDIIVTAQFRQHGIGKQLFDAVLEESKKMKVRRLEWQVLNWNEPAITFYEKLNSQFDDEWINCRLTLNPSYWNADNADGILPVAGCRLRHQRSEFISYTILNCKIKK